MNSQHLVICSAVLAAGLWVLAMVPDQPAQTEQDYFCEMHQLWLDSNGEYGWPDYNGQAHLCPSGTGGQHGHP
jgi:hypothetical protein